MLLQACIERLAFRCSSSLRVALWEAKGTALVNLQADFFWQAQQSAVPRDLHAAFLENLLGGSTCHCWRAFVLPTACSEEAAVESQNSS